MNWFGANTVNEHTRFISNLLMCSNVETNFMQNVWTAGKMSVGKIIERDYAILRPIGRRFVVGIFVRSFRGNFIIFLHAFDGCHLRKKQTICCLAKKSRKAETTCDDKGSYQVLDFSALAHSPLKHTHHYDGVAQSKAHLTRVHVEKRRGEHGAERDRAYEQGADSVQAHSQPPRASQEQEPASCNIKPFKSR